MIQYRIVNYSEYVKIAELRWIFQSEEDDSLKINEKDNFIKDCLLSIQNDNMSMYMHFGAFEHDNLIAMASLCIINKIPRPHKIIDPIGYLTNVFVLKNYRNHQIGSKLLNIVYDYAKAKDLELIIVWPSDESLKFYERLGYRPDNQPLVYKLREY